MELLILGFMELFIFGFMELLILGFLSGLKENPSPALPRSTARVRQRVVVSFLIGEV